MNQYFDEFSCVQKHCLFDMNGLDIATNNNLLLFERCIDFIVIGNFMFLEVKLFVWNNRLFQNY